MIAGAILASGLTVYLASTRVAHRQMTSASRASQAGMILSQGMSWTQSMPYGSALPANDNVWLGDTFRCARSFAKTTTTQTTQGANTINVEIITITVAYEEPDGTPRTVTGRVRRYEVL